MTFKKIIPVEKWGMPLTFKQVKQLEEYADFRIYGYLGKYVDKILIQTPIGEIFAESGDWIVKDLENNLYVVKNMYLKIP